MSVGFSTEDAALLGKLNAGSWERSFSPQQDVAWQQAETTAEELRALYDVWSLLLGTRHEQDLDDTQRVRFAAYQQMNLMLLTATFERFGLPNFQGFFAADDDPQYQEYVAHFIKEETYHNLMFHRTIAKLRAADPELRALPRWHFELFMRSVMLLLRLLPSRRVRHGMTFFFMRFAEEVTLQANTTARRAVPRAESLVPLVWELHALDEARHVAFDDLMMAKARLPGLLGRVPALLTVPVCVGASLLLNLNEIWAARTLGVKVGYLALPSLMSKTTAPFKRRVFGILSDGLARQARAA